MKLLSICLSVDENEDKLKGKFSRSIFYLLCRDGH
jgi:hypothetical protein